MQKTYFVDFGCTEAGAFALTYHHHHHNLSDLQLRNSQQADISAAASCNIGRN